MLENTHSSRSSSRRSESTTCSRPSQPPTQNSGSDDATHTEQKPNEVSLMASLEVSLMASLETSLEAWVVERASREEKHSVPSRE